MNPATPIVCILFWFYTPLVKIFEKGLLFESLGCAVLKSRKLKIVGTRIKSRVGEIDILARLNDSFYITEVKFRKNLDSAAYCVSKKQFNRSLATFFDFVNKNDICFEKYFYIVILFSVNKYKIIHVDSFNESVFS